MRYLKKAFMMLCSFAVISCGSQDSHQDLHDKLKEIRKQPGRPIEPVPKYLPTPKFHYPASSNNRDPFYSSLQKKLDSERGNASEVGAPNFNRPKQPLELFPIDGLRMVGHLKEDGRIWALVKAPDSIIYRVTMGMYMGKHYGRVFYVGEKFIGIIETVKDAGRWKKRKIKIELMKDRVDGQ